MRNSLWVTGVALLLAMNCWASATAGYSIPADKIDSKKVFYGSAANFEKAAKVNYESVIKSTPEFDEVKKKKLEPGTGRYWILLSQASDRAARAISEVGQETGYDLIAAQAYLGSIDPSIPSEDITPLVVDKIKDDNKPKDEGKARKRATRD